MTELQTFFAQTDAAFTPQRIETIVLREPIATPVRTSFGIMHHRPALLVKITDRHGAFGWGEAWCNFPACGAEHRQRLIEEVFTPLIVGRHWQHPAEMYSRIRSQTEVLTLQSGEAGPMAQALAALDMAVWDLCARRKGQPLWRYLQGVSDRIAVYASGLNPIGMESLVEQKQREGYRAFKMKVGFGREQDIHAVSHIRELIGDGAQLMLDANQAWTLGEAQFMAEQLASWRPQWLEEPMKANRPLIEWRKLAAGTPIPLAGGENLIDKEHFCHAMDSGLSVVQPDAAKWGGVTGVMSLIPEIRRRNLRYCPHYLGAGVGLLVSAHLLAAAGGDGMLEIDANPNPLREALLGSLAVLQEGYANLGELPGIGLAPDIEALRQQAKR